MEQGKGEEATALNRRENINGAVQKEVMSAMLEGSEISDLRPSLSEVLAGFGWTVCRKEKKGPFGLFGRKVEIAADCDGAAFFCGKDGSVLSADLDACCVYYRNTSLFDRCALHNGDNLIGEGDGDDETILLRLDRLPQDVHRIILVMNLFKNADKSLTFKDLTEAFIRLTDARTGEELVRVDLPVWEIDANVVVGGMLERTGRGWCFRNCRHQLLRSYSLEDMVAALCI